MLAIVDDSATATKKITVDNFRTAIGPKLETEQATTSGTSIDFTSIPSWVKKITVQFVGVSTSGSDNYLIQIGDSGGLETTGYLGASTVLTTGATSTAFTTGFGLRISGATAVAHGAVVLTLEDSANFTWVAHGIVATSNSAATVTTAGSKSLSAALDRLSITTSGGTDTFDAGAVNLLLE